jgi:hypothetical protein
MSIVDNKFKQFEDEKEFDNKNITLNVEEKKNNQVSSDTKKKATPAFLKKMKENKESIAVSFMTGNRNISESVSNEVMTKINDHLQFIGKYFDVELEDIQSKLLCAINPMNTNFHELAEKKPDLYGPFWIYTTLIFLVTLTGNMSNYFNVFLFKIVR